jgi:hypothetical protein
MEEDIPMKRVNRKTFRTEYRSGKKVVTAISLKTGRRIIHHISKKGK